MPSISSRTEEQLIASLGAQLDRAASAKSRAFWEKYLKGTIPFRGVPMGEIRRELHAWWPATGGQMPLDAQKALAFRMFQGRFCEDKLAGTLLLHEILLPELSLEDVTSIGEIFDRGEIADWNTCDWFCVKVLGNLVARDLPSKEIAKAITSWRTADALWKRRAANVAFVNLAKRGERNFPGFVKLMLETCKITVRSSERFAQTGVGWLLRELSAAAKEEVLAFTEEHLAIMSREGVHYVIERMSKREQSEILNRHLEKTRGVASAAKQPSAARAGKSGRSSISKRSPAAR